MVLDNDKTVVGIYVDDEVDESAERLEFSIVSSSTAEHNLPLLVRIESTNSGSNEPVHQEFEIMEGETTLNLVYTFDDDEFDEVNETITITIERIPGPDFRTDPLRNNVMVRIIDNDDTPKISVEAEMTSIIEGGMAIFNINSTGQSAQDLDIQLQITQNGDFILWRIPRAIKLERSEPKVSLRIATKDNTITSNDGIITVEIIRWCWVKLLKISSGSR